MWNDSESIYDHNHDLSTWNLVAPSKSLRFCFSFWKVVNIHSRKNTKKILLVPDQEYSYVKTFQNPEAVGGIELLRRF